MSYKLTCSLYASHLHHHARDLLNLDILSNDPEKRELYEIVNLWIIMDKNGCKPSTLTLVSLSISQIYLASSMADVLVAITSHARFISFCNKGFS